jgi:hypothetical protein
MSDKVSCKSCGVMILESTAQRTSGMCMPCKNGYREHIENARAYYAGERELDAHSPSRALWRDLVERVHKGSGFESLSEDEKLYFAMSVLCGEVYNGGFVQFFDNTSGEHYRSAESGLQLVGATRSLELLRQAKWVMFGEADVPSDQAVRWKAMNRAREKDLDALDEAFWKDPDQLGDKLDTFAAANLLRH